MSDSNIPELISTIFARLKALEEQFPKITSVQEGVLLSQAIEGLALALESLEITQEEVRQQALSLVSAQQAIESERRQYQDLFEFAPDAYVVTNIQGIILKANKAAFKLFNRP